jgi:hypothetical protein
MHKEIKAEWIERLLSGDYKQGKCQLLMSENTKPHELYHCCLGVLCDIYADKTGHKKTYGTFADLSYNGENGLPSHVVLDWAGLGQGQAGTLASINDCGDTFERIAEYIEERF